MNLLSLDIPPLVYRSAIVTPTLLIIQVRWGCQSSSPAPDLAALEQAQDLQPLQASALGPGHLRPETAKETPFPWSDTLTKDCHQCQYRQASVEV